MCYHNKNEGFCQHEELLYPASYEKKILISSILSEMDNIA